jgi:Glutaminyl-tRNA synthetase, non-specific RNA binding region part 1
MADNKSAPTKEVLPEAEAAKLKPLFLALGLSPKVAENALKNVALSRQLAGLCAHASLTSCERSLGALLYDLAVSSQRDSLTESQRFFVVDYIKDGRIHSQVQFKAALLHMQKQIKQGEVPAGEALSAFETACGVGVVVGPIGEEALLSRCFESTTQQREMCCNGSGL